MRGRGAAPALLAALLCACGAGGRPETPARAEIGAVVLPCGEKIKVELALTPEEQERGLMHRRSLPRDEGMLFVFPSHGERTFWMKNTLVDLDIVFVDGMLRVTRLYAGVPRSAPEAGEDGVAMVSGEAVYVLETASGAASACGAVPGARLSFLAE